MADLAVSAALVLVEDVLSFLDRELNLQYSVKDDVEDVGNWLRTIKSMLRDRDGRGDSEVIKDRISQVRELAYDIQDVLDLFKRHVSPQFHRHGISRIVHQAFHPFTDRRALKDISSQLKGIKRTMNNIGVPDRLFSNICPSGEGSSSGTRVEDHSNHNIPKKDEIVGFKEQEQTLMNHLVEGDLMCQKIWVVGLGGSGKSVLVKTVYESKKVLRKFDCHAWINASRTFKIDDILWSMLKQFCDGRKEPIPPAGVDVRGELTNYLQQKRYVVVLDDVWSKDDYEQIVNALPETFPGSKIIVTTRKLNVASSCAKSSDYILELKGLHWPDNWDLFCKKAFERSDGKCPKELEDLAQMIVEKCEGLPFAIAAIGSLLATKKPTRNEWTALYVSLGSEIAPDASLAIISMTLLPSYKDLSTKLKSCLLYFSIFPEDYSIKRGRLIRLWVAEGFTQRRRGKTPEEVAEDNLNQLIERNLVHASSWDVDGRVSSCRVLNLVREFIILKSDEENFVSTLTEPGTSSGDQKIRRLTINNSCTASFPLKGLSSVRTSFMFEWGNPFCSKIGTLLGQFRVLRVLDLQGAPLENFPKEIFELTLLKCLSLRETNIKMVPRSIKKLAYLESLDLRHTYVTELPSEILALRFLRHLLVYRYDIPNYVSFDSAQGVAVPAGIGDLSVIQKLSLVKANKHHGFIKDLKRLTQLRKLGVIDLKTLDGKALCESIQEMKDLLTLDVRAASQEEFLDLHHMNNSLSLLQRLYLKGPLNPFPAWISTLHSPVKIGLRWSRLEISPLKALQGLPNLVELLMVDSFTGELLEFEAETFKKLKVLHLEQFNLLNMVVVGTKAMPELGKLTICNCEKLEKLPSGISDLNQLEEFLVYDMPKNFIAKLQKNNKDCSMVDHIPIIHSFTLTKSEFWSLQNLS